MSNGNRVRFFASLALLLLGLPWPTAAQPERRWLADPPRLVGQRTVGPSGSRQFLDSIADVEVLDGGIGWALSTEGLLRLNGRHWQLFASVSSREFLSAIDLSSPEDGWLVGHVTGNIGSSTPPIDSIIAQRWNGTEWSSVAQIIGKDGLPIRGGLIDVVAHSDGTAFAVGFRREDHSQKNRPLALAFDGTVWREIGDENWNYGHLTNVSMVSATEGWASGLMGVPGGQGAEAVRPAILHYKSGVWTEERLPDLPMSGQPFTMYGVTMRDATEGWSIFYDYGTRCPNTALLHYTGGRWTVVPSESYGGAPILAFGIIPGTSRGWATQSRCSGREGRLPNTRLRFDGGTFTPDTGGAALAPTRYALTSENMQWGVAEGSIMRFSGEVLPTARVENPGRDRYFETTGHTLGGLFREYYESHGLDLGDPGVSDRESLALFGYPISEPFEEVNPDTDQVLQVQYFERARMEYHPENVDPYKVLLGRLTVPSLLRRTGNGEPQPAFPQQPPAAECQRFDETGHDLCPPFRAFWHGNGALPVFGFPITGARDEMSQTDRQTYLSQYFERERLEHHPELRGTPYEILLGLLGAEELRIRGYLPNN